MCEREREKEKARERENDREIMTGKRERDMQRETKSMTAIVLPTDF